MNLTHELSIEYVGECASRLGLSIVSLTEVGDASPMQYELHREGGGVPWKFDTLLELNHFLRGYEAARNMNRITDRLLRISSAHWDSDGVLRE